MRITIDGSFCPHYRCGGFAYHIQADGVEVLDSGPIETINSAYFCEVTALWKAMEMVKKLSDEIGVPRTITVITDNQSVCARMKKENSFVRQVNYHRPPPWDKIHDIMVALNFRVFHPIWKKFDGSSKIEKQVHDLAKSNTNIARQYVTDAIQAKEGTLYNT